MQPNRVQADYSVSCGMSSNLEAGSPFKTNDEAKAMRDAVAKCLKAEGYKVTRSTYYGQMRQYWTCNVYSLEAVK